MKKLSCKSCGSALQVEGFDRRLAVVHCSHCGVMYDLTKTRAEVDTSQNPSTEPTPGVQLTDQNPESGKEALQRPVAAMPAGFNVTRNGKLTVRWSWRNASAMIGVAAAIFMNLIIIFQINNSSSNMIQILFLTMTIGVLYRACAGIFNSTVITVDENQLTVRHSPLPWFPAPTINSSSVEQLFVSEGYTKSKNGTRTPYYVLNAVLRDNALKQLSSKLPDMEQALYLEQEFERALHIRDRRVAGEVRGTTRHI